MSRMKMRNIFFKYFKLFLLVLVLLIILLLLVPSPTTEKVFQLSPLELDTYRQKAKNNDLKAIQKLHLYYTFSKYDLNESILYALQGASLGDENMNRFVHSTIEYKPEALIFAAEQGNTFAIELLVKHNMSSALSSKQSATTSSVE